MFEDHPHLQQPRTDVFRHNAIWAEYANDRLSDSQTNSEYPGLTSITIAMTAAMDDITSGWCLDVVPHI